MTLLGRGQGSRGTGDWGWASKDGGQRWDYTYFIWLKDELGFQNVFSCLGSFLVKQFVFSSMSLKNKAFSPLIFGNSYKVFWPYSLSLQQLWDLPSPYLSTKLMFMLSLLSLSPPHPVQLVLADRCWVWGLPPIPRSQHWKKLDLHFLAVIRC